MATRPTDPVLALQELVRIPTVSSRDPQAIDADAFDTYLDALERLFPLIHERLELTRVDTHGLLFHWPGTGSERPVVLMAHTDVVPVEGEWQHPPFGADLVDTERGQVMWGRGTLDDKASQAAICTAVETLLADDFTPAQDVWLFFGNNEEVSGTAATLAVEELERRGVEPWFVLDEGGAVAHDAFPGVKAPIGVVGVSEKGVTSLLLTATGRGGHASTPAKNGPTARIAKAITRLESNPMGSHVPEPTVELFRRLTPHLPLPLRPLVTGLTAATPALTRVLTALGAETAAMARTTFAVTTLSGSPQLNVIAATATAGVNIRIMVGDTVAEVLDHVRTVVADDDITIDVVEQNEPSPISPRDEAFELVEQVITDCYPDAVPSPYLTMAATDSRFFCAISERVFRFSPFRMTKAQRESIHSYDEHIRVEDYLDGIEWYAELIRRLPT